MGRQRYSKVNEQHREVIAMLTFCGENLTPMGLDKSTTDRVEYQEILREKQGPVRDNRVALLKTAHRLLKDRKKNIF